MIVKYNSDPRLVDNNHMSDIVFLLDVDKKEFNDLSKAITFLQECTDAITTVNDLVPNLKPSKMKYILPEKNITVKHQLVGNMEIYSEDDGNWEKLINFVDY